MPSHLNAPLPGDLVIRELATGLRAAFVYIVSVWPLHEPIAGPYQSYGYALTQARSLSQRRDVQLWREHSLDPDRSQVENVTL